jgi:hypothetical protein
MKKRELNTWCVMSHYVALPFALKSILRQKKNYGNSTISPLQKKKKNLNPLKKKPKSFKMIL